MTRKHSGNLFLQLRVTVETTIEAGKRVRQDAFTVVVNAQGGLLEMNFRVHKGQKLLLTNPASSVQESCNVLLVRSSQEGSFLVDFEFDRPAPQFWLVHFHSADAG